MKKYLLYIGILVGGILLGWIIFGGDNKETKDSEVHLDEQMQAEGQIWTCSMHPQIRLPEPGDCPICGMTLIPLESSENSNPLVFEMTEDAMKIANIQTTVIGTSKSDGTSLKLSGKIKVDETNSASIVTHISGRIEKLFVSFTGEKISKGQKIASIYSPKLITAQKELLEAYKVKSLNPKLYDATVNKLKFWKITDSQIQSIISSDNVIESFNIYAGFSGVVLNKKVSVGDYLNEGEVLFDIQNLNQLWAVFDSYETDLSTIKIGDKITYSTPALPNRTFTSTIDFIDPVINAASRTAKIRAVVNNAQQQLKPEMFIEGTVAGSGSSKEGLSVPKSAVLWTGERSVVYVKLPNMNVPSFEFREVSIGDAIGSNYTVLSGLRSGDEVVTNGAFVIDASAQLNNQSSMMNRNLLSNNTVENSENSAPDYVAGTPMKFKDQLNQVAKTYFLVKNALVNDNAKEASKFAKILIQNIDAVDMSLVKGSAHMFWMEKNNEMKASAKRLADNTNIEKQRGSFKQISNSMIDVLKAFGVENESLYVQFCPMADDKKGGYWLSEQSAIKNPYMGEMMLTCGSTEYKLDKTTKRKNTVKSAPNMNQHNH